MKTRHFIGAVIALGLLNGCKPNLPTKPPFHLAFDATLEIEGKTYPLAFTWTEENYVAWNEGFGWHTEWKSSQKSFVRILDNKFAVVAWLPSYVVTNLDQFHPTFALIETGNREFLRVYPDLQTGESRDGVFQVTQLRITRSTEAISEKPMTKEEEALKADIPARKYGYLYGMIFAREQWSRSPDLVRLLSPLKEFTPLGKADLRARSQDIPEIWHAFYTFNAGIAMSENMDRHLFGFRFQGDAWLPSEHSGVYWYQQGLKDDSGPVQISYRGHEFDQQKNELVFDAARQHLVVVWRYGLESP